MGLDQEASDQFRDMDPYVSWSHCSVHCNGDVVDWIKHQLGQNTNLGKTPGAIEDSNKKPPRELGGLFIERLRWELNPRVADLQSAALATWLRSHLSTLWGHLGTLWGTTNIGRLCWLYGTNQAKLPPFEGKSRHQAITCTG